MEQQRERPLASAVSRRRALVGLGASGAAVVAAMAAGSAGPAAASAPTSAPAGPGAPAGSAADGRDHPATPMDVRQLFTDYLAAKSAHNVAVTMSFFAPDMIEYADATVGWTFPSWSALQALFQQYMPQWPAAARSYATEIVGGETGAIVRFTNTPEEFGHEIRGIAIVDIRDGKFVRWVDYWDGRHFGVDATAQLRLPAAKFPATFGEGAVGEHAAAPLGQVVTGFAGALSGGDVTGAAGFLDADVVLSDLALQTEIIGKQAVTGYLTRAVAQLPYGAGSAVRHIVGGAAGGGYEWTNPSGLVPRGANVIRLTDAGMISQLTATWDGSLVSPTWITDRMATAIQG